MDFPLSLLIEHMSDYIFDYILFSLFLYLILRDNKKVLNPLILPGFQNFSGWAVINSRS